VESGRVFQINISEGGVPKHPIHEGQINEHGLAGDRHADLKNHGGPDRALCLFSLELILMLQEAGHPIFPGSTGENLTITGLAWDRLEPGAQLWIGAEVRIEITAFTQPCYKIKESFAGGEFCRMSQKDYPGSARLYARVLKSGTVRIGDTVSPNKPVAGDE
jgi:MOSC domain-containing protein YiiM